jgi:hypothetical protein
VLTNFGPPINPVGKIMRILSVLAALFLGLVALAPTSQAATINLAVNFTATGFSSGPATITGSFDAMFDPTNVYVNDANVVSNFHINNITIPTGPGDILFSYAPILGATIGGSALTSFLVQKGADDFRLIISLLGNAFTYSQVGLNKKPNTFDVTVNISPIAATPIPASLVMLLTSLGALGGVGYLRGRKAQPKAAMLAA